MPMRNKRYCNDQSADEYSEIIGAGSKRKRQCINALQNDALYSPNELSHSQQTMLEDANSYNTFLFQPTHDAQIDYTPQIKFEVNDGYTTMGFVPYITYDESQFRILEDEFEKSQWLDFQRRRELVSLLNLNEIQIENWFANRRVKQTWQEQCGQFCSQQVESVDYSPLSGLSNNEYQVRLNIFNNNQYPTFEDEYSKCQLPEFHDKFHELASKPPLIDNSVTTWVDDQLSKQNILVQRLQAKTVSSGCDSSLSSTGSRLRRKRAHFSKDQLIKLKQKFEECRYIDYDKVSELALDLNLTNVQVRTWFKNRRSKKKLTKNLGQFLQSPMKTDKQVSSSPNSKKKGQSSGTFTLFDQTQVSVLEQEFEKCHYPHKNVLVQLAIATNSTEDRVANCFQVHRRKQELKNKIRQSQTETSGSPTPIAFDLMNTNEFCQTPISHSFSTSSSKNWLDQQYHIENSTSEINQKAAAFLRNGQFQRCDSIIENSERMTPNENLQLPFSSSPSVDYSSTALVYQQCDTENTLSKIDQKVDVCSQDWPCERYDEVIGIPEAMISKEICQSPISNSVTINYSPTAWLAKKSDIKNELLKANLGVNIRSQNWQCEKYDKMTSPLPIQQYNNMRTLLPIKKEDECGDLVPPTAEYVCSYYDVAAIDNQVTLFEL